MLKMFTATTAETESPADAMAEILAQLDLPKNRLRNAAAIITCSPEFIEVGITSEVIAELAMPTIGCVTYVNADNCAFGETQLAVAVLTSDDVDFAAIAGEVDEKKSSMQISALYADVRAKFTSDPAMILALLSLLPDYGEQLFKALDAAVGDVPIFGAVSNNLNADGGILSDRCFVFGNDGKMFPSGVGIIAMRGNLAPRFFTESVPIDNDELVRKTGTVTRSEGKAIYDIDGEPASKYFQTWRMSEDLIKYSLPALINYGDGEWVGNGVIDEHDGAYFWSMEVPTGAKIAPARSINYAVVMETGEELAHKIRRAHTENPGALVLVSSCIGRLLLASPMESAEYEKIREILANELPLFYFSASGEICPKGKAPNLRNRFHNYTCCAALL